MKLLTAGWPIIALLLGQSALAPGDPKHLQEKPSRARAPAATKQASLSETIAALLEDPAVSRDHWGISVKTLEGKTIYAHNDGEYFTPASNTKLFTTAAAMAMLPDKPASESVLDPLQNCVDSQGEVLKLVLAGTGDPTFSSRAYPFDPQHLQGRRPELADLQALADQVKEHGIRSVANVVGDDRLFPFERYGSGWSWDDLQWGDGAPVSALTINDNVVSLELLAGEKAGDAVTSSWNPAVAYYTLDNQAVTSSAGTKTQLGLERAPGSKTVRLFGSIPVTSKGVHLKLAIEDPAEFAAVAFRQMLLDRGIAVQGGASALHQSSTGTLPFEDAIEHTPVPAPISAGGHGESQTCTIKLSRTEPWLRQDIILVDKISQNLHAELLLRRLGQARSSEGSFIQGAAAVRQFALAAGINPDDFFFYDGSGLSATDIVTPRAITTLLSYAATQPWGEEWRASLPVAGVDGTLANRFTQSPLKGKVFAKTGTLSEVNALSGYVVARSGRTVVFSILLNNHRPESLLKPDPGRNTIDKIVEAVAGAS